MSKLWILIPVVAVGLAAGLVGRQVYFYRHYVAGQIMDGPGMVNVQPWEVLDGDVVDNSTDAPQKIQSTELVALETNFYVWGEENEEDTGWVSFTLRKGEDGTVTLALGSDDPVPVRAELPEEVRQVIEKFGLTGKNGTDRVTSGLPDEYQPCRLRAEYASGETLTFRENNNPRADWALELRALFLGALEEAGG